MIHITQHSKDNMAQWLIKLPQDTEIALDENTSLIKLADCVAFVDWGMIDEASEIVPHAMMEAIAALRWYYPQQQTADTPWRPFDHTLLPIDQLPF